MATRSSGIIGLATLLLAGACDSEDAAAESVTLRDVQVNGFQLNGFQLNGFQLNGFQLNGHQLNNGTDHITVTRIKLNGGDKGSQSWLTGSQLSVLGKKSVVSTGSALVGATIEFEVQEGGKKSKGVRIKSVTPIAPGSDVMLYNLEINSSGWKPLCEDGGAAILLGDVWDPLSGDREGLAEAVTFACRGAALAKCVEFGYRPWATASGVSLREHHQACTRMVRADYCGEGLAHTTNGTPIHVLDSAGIQTASASVNYVVEAEWGPDGATCLNPANTRHSGQVIDCDIPVCGASFTSGGLVQSGKIL